MPLVLLLLLFWRCGGGGDGAGSRENRHGVACVWHLEIFIRSTKSTAEFCNFLSCDEFYKRQLDARPVESETLLFYAFLSCFLCRLVSLFCRYFCGVSVFPRFPSLRPLKLSSLEPSGATRTRIELLVSYARRCKMENPADLTSSLIINTAVARSRDLDLDRHRDRKR